MNGFLTYWTHESRVLLKSLRLTVCTSGDMEAIGALGLAEVRRRRLLRILGEARRQGAHLTYRDLSLILLTSKATLKRDMRELRRRNSIDGVAVLEEIREADLVAV